VHIRRPLRHDAVVERLWRAAAERRLPHALAFEGARGIGKFAAAKWFATGLLCERGPGAPCLACPPCKRVLSGGVHGNHADLFVLDPVHDGEEQIRVGRIAYRPDGELADPERCVERFLELRAVEGGMRPVLIRESQRMNAEAQNAFLKTLEEPRPDVLIVLETHAPDALLATIRSRCVRIRFEPLSRAECVQILVEEGLGADEAAELARWSSGSPGKALALVARGARELRAVLVEALAGERLPFELAAAARELPGEFEGSTETARDRDRARTAIELAMDLLRDVLRRQAGIDPAELPHGDASELARGRGPRPRDVERALEELSELRADVDRNLQPGALVERALLVLCDLRGVPGRAR
jgi:DNA polymerase III delta' subunit